AARLGKAIGARRVIPHHYHMFEFDTADPSEFIKEAQAHGQAYTVLQHGERFTYRATQTEKDRGQLSKVKTFECKNNFHSHESCAPRNRANKFGSPEFLASLWLVLTDTCS